MTRVVGVRRVLLCALGVVILMLAVPQAAVAQPGCDQVCYPWLDCGTACRLPNGVTATCEAYGVCNGLGTTGCYVPPEELKCSSCTIYSSCNQSCRDSVNCTPHYCSEFGTCGQCWSEEVYFWNDGSGNCDQTPFRYNGATCTFSSYTPDPPKCNYTCAHCPDQP